MKNTILLLLVLLLGLSSTGFAQRQTANWRFGTQAGLLFPVSGSPTAVTGSITGPGREGCSVVSDEAGNLLCYSNGVQVWDRTEVAMPNGTLSYGQVSATQGALFIPAPGSAQQIYLFTVDAVENNLNNGLRYSILDMSLRNGLGDIGATKEVAVPTPSNVKLTEKLTAVRHANGYDFWIVVHAYGSNLFFSYLLTATGLSTTPVTSSLGRVHSGGGGSNGNGNAVGYMRASPNGQRLAVAIREVGLDVFDFNTSTGAVSNYQPVNMSADYYYGAEFSPDGSKLYTSDLTGNSIRQIDLNNSSLTAQYVGSAANYTGAIVRGPNGVLYIAVELANYLAVITNPNGPATSCGFAANGISLGSGVVRQGLPNFANAYRIPNYWTGNVSTDYLLPGNWNAGYVPSATDDVTIPAAAVRMPVLSGPVSHRAFTIESGASMTLNLGGTLSLSADLTNNGTLQGEGTLATTGAATQQFNGQPFTLGGVTVGSAGATLGTNLSLTRVLTLNGNLTATGRVLTLLSTATGTAMVVNNGAATVTGPATVQRYVGPAQNAGLGYRHVAAPVAGVAVSGLQTTNFVPLANPAYNTTGNSVTPFPTVYSYNQNRVTTTGGALADFDLGWQSPASTSEALGDMTGYTLNMPAGETFSFTGPLHNGSYTRSNLLRGNGLQSGWHFLGNPYPAPISWTQAYAGATGLDNAVYVYQSSGQYAGAYASFVNGVSINGGSDEIALGRGFFVRTSAAGTPGQLALTNAARLSTYANPNFQRPAPERRPLLRLALTASTGPADEAVAYIETNATTGFDARYDAFKIVSGQRSLGFALGSDLLAAQALPPLNGTPVVLPLRVLVERAGTFTIEARELRNFAPGTQLLLHDTETGTVTPLQADTRYTFSAPLQEQPGRFFLRLHRPTASPAPQPLHETTVYPNPAHDRLWLARPAAMAGQAATLTLRNGLGQVVRRQQVAATAAEASVSLAGLARGVYTLQVQSATGSLNRRVVVE